MLKKMLATAVLASLSLNSQAALQSIASWDAVYPAIAGVEFNAAQFNGVTVALGAHAYKNGVFLPNDGTSTFYAQTGTYAAEDRANWSFDFLIDARNYSLSSLSVRLEMDSDPSAAQNFGGFPDAGLPNAFIADSWNMEMDFLEAQLGAFDPNANGIYDFRLSVFDSDNPNDAMVSTSMRVVVGTVPEPGSLTLAALGLLGAAALRRRRR